MTVKKLKEILNKYNDNAKVYVGCQGYTNFDDPIDEYTICIEEDVTHNVFITDGCGYARLERS